MPSDNSNNWISNNKQLTVSVNEGECFGLLGANGAGKTTTFKILTGVEPSSSGTAYISSHCILNQMNQVSTFGFQDKHLWTAT